MRLPPLLSPPLNLTPHREAAIITPVGAAIARVTKAAVIIITTMAAIFIKGGTH